MMHRTFLAGAILLLVGLLDNVTAGPAERVARSVHKAFDASCGKTYNMQDGKGSKRITGDAGTGKCSWIFLGNNKCHPEIKCTTLDLKKSDDCSDVALTISDGLGGESRLCGAVPFIKPKIASQGARDLFVEFHNGGHKNGKGFDCEISCSKNTAGADALPLEGTTKKEEFKCVCGLQNKNDRIVGGEATKMNEFPWQVAIVKPGTRSPMCGGSVINNKYILTAAHCFWFQKTPPEKIEVLIHAHLLDFTITKANANKNIKLGLDGSMQGAGFDFAKKQDADEKTQRFKIEEIIMHDLFNPGYDYDVAVLRLKGNINLLDDSAPTPVCLPKAANYNEFYAGAKPTVVGWGLPDELAGATTRLQQKLEAPVIPLEECKKMMPHELTDRMLCAGYKEGKKDACTGDSGGTLNFKRPNKQYEQIGIVSWGEGCARANRPGLYSRVTEFIQWINHHANKPGTIWCRDQKN